MQTATTAKTNAFACRTAQGVALLLVCRLALFFCSNTAFSAAEAAGIFVATIVQGLLLAPLLLRTDAPPHGKGSLWAYRLFGGFWAARVLAAVWGMLTALQAPYPRLSCVLLLLVACYAASLPFAATGRAVGLLLTVAGIAFAFLLLGGVRKLEPLLLWSAHTGETPATNASRLWTAFVRAWSQSGELVCVPLLLQNAPTQNRRMVSGWLLGKGLGLPLLIGFGLLRNGRLLQWAGNPFFFLLTRVQRFAAFRTDGFWLLLALTCAGTAVTVSLQMLALPSATSKGWFRVPYPWLRLLPIPAILAVAALFVRQLPADGWFAGGIALLGIGLPYGERLWDWLQSLRQRRKTEGVRAE